MFISTKRKYTVSFYLGFRIKDSYGICPGISKKGSCKKRKKRNENRQFLNLVKSFSLIASEQRL